MGDEITLDEVERIVIERRPMNRPFTDSAALVELEA